MINVEIYRNSRGKVSEFKVCGHADFDEHGKDIVCAAVSALTQTAFFSIKSLAHIAPKYAVSNGRFHCNVRGLNDRQREIADIILESMVIGLKEIRKEYSDHIRITEIMEV